MRRGRGWKQLLRLAAGVSGLAWMVAGCGSFGPSNAPKEYPIAVTSQSADRILVFDPAATDWSEPKALKWSWQPTADNGFDGLNRMWGLPTDAKVRTNEVWGGQWMVFTDSSGLAGIIPYPQGDAKKWGLAVGDNPHSAELLPNGNIAIAASTGGWVRVYASSQGSSADKYAQYAMPGAHAVLWDPQRQVLWAAGDDALVSLRVAGSDAAPALEEAERIALPTKHAHAVEPVYGNPDRLWVASGSQVYQYVKSTKSFDSAYPGREAISRVGVKSIGNQPSGEVVETVPDMAKKPPGGCKANNWCTETVDRFRPEGGQPGAGAWSRIGQTLSGEALYKARILNPNYQ
ncbi:DUF6528 family protein [Paenibacillus sp. HJGM_3]|uniref:DUF6528 family protein n=1 Tax=Paenibacillus sp. HJGM_3 TaxID=3379816 RepID=UPI00385CB165